jgi:hypothetical protein
MREEEGPNLQRLLEPYWIWKESPLPNVRLLRWNKFQVKDGRLKNPCLRQAGEISNLKFAIK